MKRIYFITSNKGKFKEAQNKLKEIRVEVVQKNLGYPEIQTDSLEEVALFGVKHIQERFDKPFILEDAGLFIESLYGFPGVYSSFFYHTIGCKGVLKLLEGFENRKALFRSVFGYGDIKQNPVLFIGECQGSISKEERGSHGFGYDPIFIPDGELKTFAEMEIHEKNSYSHRGKSLLKLIDFFKNK